MIAAKKSRTNRSSDKKLEIPDMTDLISRTVFAYRIVEPNTSEEIFEVLTIAATVHEARAFALGFNRSSDEAINGFAFVGHDELRRALALHLSA